MFSEIGKTIGQWIIGHVGWSILIVLFLLSCFFKIAKKEIDPLGWVIGLFGKALTKDVRKDIKELKADSDSKIADLDTKLTDLRGDFDDFKTETNNSIKQIQCGTNANCDQLKKRLAQIEKSNDLQTVRQIKAHVLDFANSCLNGRKHTKKEFENIMKENEDYEKLCKKYRLKNSVYKEDYAFVLKVYHKCQEDGSFLKESDVIPE